jgi:hypothetical protein
MVQKKNYKVEQMEVHTLTWWRSREPEIDMDPTYQRRGRLWSSADQSYLIDSILNGFDVPKVYVADFTWADSPLNHQRKAYAIIDGKQRLEAIFNFFKGTLVLSPDFKYRSDPQLSLGGLGYQDLKRKYPQVCEVFDEYNLLVMRVIAQSEEPITELFVRLNRSKPLSGAEIRNAMNGPAPALFRSIAKHDLFLENVSFTMTRGQDLNAAAKLLSFEFSGSPVETKKSALDKFVRATSKETELLELAGRRVLDTLDAMAEIFLPKDKLLASAGAFPVFFWFVRNTSSAKHPSVREFLVRFEEERRENRDLSTSNPDDPAIDRELLLYDQLNRSTDDIRSHEKRYEILKKRFLSFLRKH